MKRLFMITALVITLCNVGAGVVYACSCFENEKKVCEGTYHCYQDAGGKCHCKDAPATEE